MRRYSALLTAAVFMAGCAADLALPDAAQIDCASTDDCPGDRVCSALGRCITQEEAAEAPPELAEPPTLTPREGTVGTVFSLTFTASKVLSEDPLVQLSGGATTERFALDEAGSERSEQRYRYTYTADGSETAGSHQVTVDLVDEVGNEARGLLAGSLVLDFTPPSVVLVELPPAPLAEGDTALLGVVLSEAPGAAPSVLASAGANAFPWQLDAGAGTTELQLSLQATASMAEGDYEVTLLAVDRAGNESGALVLGQITLDYSPPAVDPSSVVLAPALAGPGRIVRATFVPTEPLAIPPVVEMRPAGGAPLPLVAVAAGGAVLEFIYQVPLDPALVVDGAHPVHVTNLTDLAGNAGSDVVLGAVTLDATPPAIAAGSYVQNSSTFGATGTLTVQLEVTELLAEPPRLRLSQLPLTFVQGSGTGPFSYSLDIATAALSGVATLYADLVDRAGNPAFIELGSASLDPVPPALIDAQLSPSRARLGTGAVLTLTASEYVGDTLDVTALTFDADPGFAFQNRSGLNYNFALTVDDSIDEGDYRLLAVVLTDAAGNTAAITLPAPLVFSVDNVPPSVTPCGAPPRPLARAGDEVRVSFLASEGLAGAPSVSLAGIDLAPAALDPACTPAGAQTAWTFAHRADATADPEGPLALTVELADPAGNVTVGTLGTVTLDFSPPFVVAARAAPDPAPLGSTLVYTVTASEPLTEEPTLVLAGPGAPALVYQSGTTFTFTYEVQGSAADGAYAVTVAMEDLAGNPGSGGGAPFAIDGTPPSISNAQTDAQRYSAQPGFDRVVVTFDSDDLDAVPGGVAVLLDGEPMACGAYQGSSPRYRCTYDVLVTDTSGTKDIEVTTTDAAGNTDLARLDVVFDLDPPILVATDVGPSPAGVGDPITYAVTVNEPLARPPALTTSGAGNLTFVHQPDTSYLFRYTVGGSEATGTYASHLDLVDSVGNERLAVAGPSFAVDTGLPTISFLGADRAAYSRVAGFAVVTVTFDCADDLDPVGGPTVTLDDEPMTCGAYSAVAPSYVCTYDVGSLDSPGDQRIVVTTADAAGNDDTDSVLVTFDFTGPSVVPGSEGLALLPGAGNPLRDVTTVKLGTAVELTFILDELTSAPPVVESTDAALGFVRVSAVGTFFRYAHTLASAPAQGSVALQVRATDAVGNLATRALGVSFTIDTLGPAPPSVGAADVIVYRRRPWGADGTGPDPLFTLDAGAGAVEDGAWLLVYDRDDLAAASELGRAQATAGGAAGTLTLSRADRAEVFASAVDAAGNQSALVRVRDVEWIASLGGKVQGQTLKNPHRVEARRFGPLLFPRDSVELAGEASLASRAAPAVASSVGPSWLDRTGRPGPTWNLGSDATAAAFDRARGVALTVDVPSPNGPRSTWLWDGVKWTAPLQAVPPPFPGQQGYAMVYDTYRDRVVVFGGYLDPTQTSPARATDETWEWDGATWRQVTTVSAGGDPAPRFGHQMTFDAERGVTLLYGGRSVFGQTSCPPNATLAGAAGDECYFHDTWEYDGRGWRDATPAGPQPPPVVYAGFAFDARRGVAVLFGGNVAYSGTTCPGYTFACDQTWEWDGAAWAQATPSDLEGDGNPTGRMVLGMAYDEGMEQVLLFGGFSADASGCDGGASCANTWVYDGARWSRRNPPDPEGDGNPVESGGGTPPLVYDSTRGRVVMAGRELWEWEDPSWRQIIDSAMLPPPAPPFPESFIPTPAARAGAAATSEPGTGEVILFGGAGAGSVALSDTWRWDGQRWRQVAPADTAGDGNPGPRLSHALVHDDVRGVAVMAGGWTADSYAICGFAPSASLNETWEWTGQEWNRVANLPSEPGGHAMAFDGQAPVIVGGLDIGSFSCVPKTATLVYGAPTASSWNIASTTGVPTGLLFGAMASDLSRGRTVHFGGSSTTGMPGPLTPSGETWELDRGPEPDVWNLAASSGPEARLYPAMVYDEQRQRVLLMGGEGASALLGDLWEWDGVWTRIEPEDPENDGNPLGRARHVMAYDANRGVPIVFGGGISTTPYVNDTWEWRHAAVQPAQVSVWDFSRAEGPEPWECLTSPATCTLRALEVTWFAGATGYLGATPVTGATLHAWRRGRWVDVGVANTAAHAAADSAAAELHYTTTDPGDIATMFTGPARALYLAVTPKAPNGASTALVTSDYVEVAVRYRLP